MLTLGDFKNCLKANFHKVNRTSVPSEIMLAQLLRWIGYGFVPLPIELEIQNCHLPILRPDVLTNSYGQRVITAKDKILSLLQHSILSGYGINESGIREKIPNKF